MEECRFSKMLAKKVKTSEQWDAEHKSHGGFSTRDSGHPSGSWIWKTCKCGAMHLRSIDTTHPRSER